VCVPLRFCPTSHVRLGNAELALVISLKNGLLGHASRSLEIGDPIAIIQGRAVPHIWSDVNYRYFNVCKSRSFKRQFPKNLWGRWLLLSDERKYKLQKGSVQSYLPIFSIVEYYLYKSTLRMREISVTKTGEHESRWRSRMLGEGEAKDGFWLPSTAVNGCFVSAS
jgi:hypothetical protein